MQTALALILAVVLGWLTGMVVNYVADVLPLRRRLSRPFCPACDAQIPWLAYFLLPRRCPTCGQPRPWRTWLVASFYTIATAALWFSPPTRLGFWVAWLLLAYFGVVVVIDVEYRLILHSVSLAGAALGTALGVGLHGVQSTLFGGLAGFAMMAVLYLAGAVMLRWLTRWRQVPPGEVALGFGDVTLGGVIGLVLGWPLINLGLMLAVLLGGVVSLLYLILMMLARRYRLFTALPYGPFLVAGAAAVLFFGNLLRAWLN